MILLAGALITLADVYTETSVDRALRFLVRHQTPDGSWGRRPESCTCPLGRTPFPTSSLADDDLRRRFEVLLEPLQDDRPAIREKAQRDLEALGQPVVPLLLDRVDHSDPELRSRCRDALRVLGKWNPPGLLLRAPPFVAQDFDVKITSLAILAFNGTGYSSLSRDEWIDPLSPGMKYKVGAVVANALRWLIDRQKEDGSFTTTHPAIDAIAAVALSEAFGMTELGVLREPALRAVAYVRTLDSPDPEFLVWKGILLTSAYENKHTPKPDQVLVVLAERLDRGESALSVSGSLLLSVLGRRSSPDPTARFEELDRAAMTPEECFVASLAVSRTWTVETAERRSWMNRTKEEWNPTQIVSQECGRGSWVCYPDGAEARMVAAVYGIHLLHHYYRYANTLLAQIPP